MDKINKEYLVAPSTSASVGKDGASSDLEDESPEENIPVPVALIGAENYLTLTEVPELSLVTIHAARKKTTLTVHIIYLLGTY